MSESFQRIGSISNSHVGKEFEKIVKRYLERQELSLQSSYPLEIGLNKKKIHKFDIGSHSPKVIVECKSHRWTTGDNMPSAKLTVWNEAMFYFLISPKEYRKLLFVLKDFNPRRRETLAEYYIRTNYHLIPEDVEIWEFDETEQVAYRIR